MTREIFDELLFFDIPHLKRHITLLKGYIQKEWTDTFNVLSLLPLTKNLESGDHAT